MASMWVVAGVKVPAYYHTAEDIEAAYRELSGTCNRRLTIDTSGPLMRLTLAERPGASDAAPFPSSKGPTRALLFFGEHARELISPEVGLAFVRGLCAPPELAPEWQDTVSNVRFTILPLINRWGRSQVLAGGRYCLRTNEHSVDVNRNWDSHWRAHQAGDPDQTDPGAQPWSEPETVAMRDTMQQAKPHVFMTVHSGALGMYTPFAFSTDDVVTRTAETAIAAQHAAARFSASSGMLRGQTGGRTESESAESAQARAKAAAAQQQAARAKTMHSMLDQIVKEFGACPHGSAGHELGYLCPGTCLDYAWEHEQVPLTFAFEVWDAQARGNKGGGPLLDQQSAASDVHSARFEAELAGHAAGAAWGPVATARDGGDGSWAAARRMSGTAASTRSPGVAQEGVDAPRERFTQSDAGVAVAAAGRAAVGSGEVEREDPQDAAVRVAVEAARRASSAPEQGGNVDFRSGSVDDALDLQLAPSVGAASLAQALREASPDASASDGVWSAVAEAGNAVPNRPFLVPGPVTSAAVSELQRAMGLPAAGSWQLPEQVSQSLLLQSAATGAGEAADAAGAASAKDPTPAAGPPDGSGAPSAARAGADARVLAAATPTGDGSAPLGQAGSVGQLRAHLGKRLEGLRAAQQRTKAQSEGLDRQIAALQGRINAKWADEMLAMRASLHPDVAAGLATDAGAPQALAMASLPGYPLTTTDQQQEHQLLGPSSFVQLGAEAHAAAHARRMQAAAALLELAPPDAQDESKAAEAQTLEDERCLAAFNPVTQADFAAVVTRWSGTLARAAAMADDHAASTTGL